MRGLHKVALAAVLAFGVASTSVTLAQETGSVGEPAVIEDISGSAQLNFVNADGLNAGDPMKTSAFLSMIKSSRGDLHDRINANAGLASAIEANGHSVDDVMYIKNDGGGVYTVYVD